MPWERHLTEAAARGDEAARTLFVEAFRPYAFRIAMDRLGSLDDASDIAQEAILKALAHLGEFDASRPVRPWLARITANLVADLGRARKRRPEAVLDDAVEDRRADGEADRGVVAAVVRTAVGRLPEPYRSAIRMRHFEELDVSEIAARMSVPEGTVKSWLHRARGLLRADAALA